ncbi:MAG: DUF6288 domain-containing protein [Mariniblastus sp.]|nr:DUF6288 domain-containing protein [Mariniblastus sp.]
MHHASRYYWTIFGVVLLVFGGGTLCAYENFPLGILGGTGRVTPNLAHIEIVAVLDGSPAHQAGLQTGDQINGIAGHSFPPHSNQVDQGGSGPQRVLGEALDEIADRQDEVARNLILNIQRPGEGGPSTLEITCSLPYRAGVLEASGRQQLIDRAADHLRRTCLPQGYWNSPVGLTGDRVLTAWATVALQSLGKADDREALQRCRTWLRGPEGRSWVPDNALQKGPDNLGNWALTASVVALVEGCQGQPDADEKRAIQVICSALRQRMDAEGRFGHDVTTGYGGKGFNVINTLAHLAWAMGSQAGVPIDESSWNRSLEQVRQSVDPDGGVRYWTMKNTGTADASLRTSSMALGLAIAGQEDELVEGFSNYLDQHAARTREAHAVGSMGMILAPAVLWRHDRAAYQRFLQEWRWYLSLMQDHRGQITYIGGKRNNGGDSYLGTDRIACVIAIMLLSPTDGKLILFKD